MTWIKFEDTLINLDNVECIEKTERALEWAAPYGITFFFIRANADIRFYYDDASKRDDEYKWILRILNL